MSAILSIPELVEREKYCLMTPCVYDCASARAAEIAGYKAILLSGGEVGESLGAISEAEMTESEFLFVASHICEFSPLPLIIDCGCFSPEPTSVFRWTKKFAQAGAMAMLIEDGEGTPKEDFLKMVNAAVHACAGTRCVVIGRTNRRMKCDADIDFVVEVLNKSMELGAYMTMACGLNSAKKARIIGERVKGLKMYPDQNTHDGKPEVVNEEIYELGYAMISFHYALKVAMANMIEYGIQDLQTGHNGPSNDVAFYNGVRGASSLPMFDYQAKLDRAAEYTGVRETFHIPGEEMD